MIHLNYLAIFVSALAYFFLGWAWHSPLLFMKIWAKEMGFDKMSKKQQQENMKKMPLSMAGNFVIVLVTAWVLANVIQFAGVALQRSGLVHGLTSGFYVWLGFYATTLFNTVLWEGRSLKLYAINASYHLVGLLMMGAILASWA